MHTFVLLLMATSVVSLPTVVIYFKSTFSPQTVRSSSQWRWGSSGGSEESKLNNYEHHENPESDYPKISGDQHIAEMKTTMQGLDGLAQQRSDIVQLKEAAQHLNVDVQLRGPVIWTLPGMIAKHQEVRYGSLEVRVSELVLHEARGQIIHGIQDINNYLSLERNSRVKRRNLSKTLKKLMDDARPEATHFIFAHDDIATADRKATIFAVLLDAVRGQPVITAGLLDHTSFANANKLINAVIDAIRDSTAAGRVVGPDNEQAIRVVDCSFNHALTVLGKKSCAELFPFPG